ncbi:hypothetical protein lerEdw1_009249 [Lerista edwardsae]|nr:hypothetical protein lerEdw1_009249 [Lerista edwardsae]
MSLPKGEKCRDTYCKDWEEQKELKDWLLPVAGDEGKAACRFCECKLLACYSELQQHMALNSSASASKTREEQRDEVKMENEPRKARETFHFSTEPSLEDIQWREEAPEGLPGWTESEREALSDELSDVLIYLVALADKCRVDLPTAALRKMEKNSLKYPAKQVYGSSKKYTEYQK